MSSFKAHLINKKYRMSIILALVLVGFLANDVFQQASDDTANQPTNVALPTLNNTTKIASKEPNIGQLKPLVKETKDEIVKETMLCKNHLNGNSNERAWRKDKQSYIRTFITQLNESGASANVLDKIFVESGIGLYKGRAILTGYQKRFRQPPYHQGEAIKANVNSHILIQTKLQADDIDGLAGAIEDQTLHSNEYYMGKKGAVFLLSYLLEKKVLEKKPNNSIELIDQLIDSGIKVSYADLAKVTTLNLPQSTVNKLFITSHLPANQILKHRHKYTSLALIAITANNSELARYWISLGSPVQPDLFADNALDLLAKNGQRFNQSQIDELFSDIMSAGISPFESSRVKQLEALVSPHLFNLHKEKMLEVNVTLLPEQIKTASSAIENIHAYMLNNRVDFELNTQPKHQCFSEIGKLLTQTVMTSRAGKKQVATNRPNIDSKIKDNQPLSLDELIASAKRLNTKAEDIEAELGSIQSLGNKQALEQFRRQELVKLMQGFNQQIESAPQLKQKNLTAMEAIKLAQAGKWAEAIALLDKLDNPDVNSKSTLVLLAISTDTDFSIIKSLLDSGGELVPNAIVQIISKNNVELAKQLLPYGLDLNYVEMGYSTLAKSVQWGALDMLNFLVKQGVPMDIDQYGFDALDIALKQYDQQTTGLTYVATLISAGAKIELNHKEIIDKMKLNNMAAYYQITNTYRDLKLLP